MIAPRLTLLLPGLLLLGGQAGLPARADRLRQSVVAFGAKGDGRALDTAAIQRAIDRTGASGGGVVEIPRGTFRSGSIFLKAGVELELADGAVLLGSNRIEDYPKRLTRIEGHFEPWRAALVNAEKMDRVRIGGRGTLDGNGILFWAAFWQRRRENPDCTNLEVERPRLVFIDRCHDVQVAGLNLRDAGFWNLHLYRCTQVVIDRLRITAPSTGNILAPSTDGIDVDSSQDVAIRRCYISVNDDNIALKGTKGPWAAKDPSSPPVERILVEDCEFGDGNGVITCGSEATIVRHVRVRRCRITGQTNLLCLKLRPDTPQDYEDIVLEDITLSGGAGRILDVAPWTQFFDLHGQPPPAQRIAQVAIRHVRGVYGSFGRLRGNPGSVIAGVTLEDFDVQLREPRLDTDRAAALTLRRVRVNGIDLP